MADSARSSGVITGRNQAYAGFCERFRSSGRAYLGRAEHDDSLFVVDDIPPTIGTEPTDFGGLRQAFYAAATAELSVNH